MIGVMVKGTTLIVGRHLTSSIAPVIITMTSRDFHSYKHVVGHLLNRLMLCHMTTNCGLQ